MPATTTTTRRRRGAATQTHVAGFLRDHGFPWATDAGAGRDGIDILGTPHLAVEVKARRAFAPLEWLRQARKQAHPGDLPVVVFRCDGQGPGTVAEWPVLLRLADFTQLARAAGYGQPPTSENTVEGDVPA